MRFCITAAVVVVSGMLSTAASWAADKQYDPGASDTEIKIGQTMPYSGPASAYGTQGRTEAAYWKMINSQGGINGRKVTLLSMDDGYSPPKTVEQTRKLVEQDEILANIGSLGTPTNSSIQKYLNGKKVPHILISTGASKWNDAKNFPWTTPFYPPYAQEARIYAKYILKELPGAKIGVIYQNDDFGKDYLRGFKEGLGEKADLIVKELSYEVTDPTIDSQIVTLKSAGADVLMTITTPKFGAQAIRKVNDLVWKPTHFIVSVASSIGGVLEPAGLEASTGLITALATKVVGDPAWDSDPGVQDYLAFMKQWYPEGNPIDGSNQIGYTSAQFTAIILKNCGDVLTRENVLKQATNINKVSLPLLLPGITVSVSPTDYSTFDTFKLARFDGKTWKFFGENLSAVSR
ncbi:ABC transporter substrate-binding protein [Bradyrhizobium diazoefficiens]|jgi:ABC-type branched-subunit amino acid transport system substrate-binding protein|nr:ABC transporter substrate-binding protein [Bradyrhizobium diazoefficiens]MBR0963251.1 ABC transporter substrate-binding protein [Bradyrhizobium diazoefficiens]MBR0976065.1 ABC transporter substrate-binding protein [Bradyrhizobium diazoefficiens]MBR1006913.1 ABC transporter substrate-binding protein [Bradyrhizobium diazoefficiens]MBR1013024.1 ABC transporter substrate-binding protein [Bradyrhizobium diazoefficiens]MBR1049844.1 ABC transporter substrate-binding protein [Bradyrhizobium diazoef